MGCIFLDLNFYEKVVLDILDGKMTNMGIPESSKAEKYIQKLIAES